MRNESLSDLAKRLRPEFVVGITGRVDLRAKEAINPKIKTGEIEVAATDIRLLNDAKTPPFPINEDTPVSEEMRLRYRYLDLRRPRLQQNMILRHKTTFEVRRYFDEQNFLEIETPILTKSTPEGARDYLVPSRVHPGEFFALPQSPQIFKQILMIAGLDRYFQIAKCFRDEDLRADRQPEFTQVDLEISLRDREPGLLDPRAADGTADGAGRPRRAEDRSPGCRTPKRSRATAPTSRTCGRGWRSRRCRNAFAASSFSVFKSAIDAGGEVRGFVVPNGARYSRKELDDLIEEAKQLGAAGLVWARSDRRRPSRARRSRRRVRTTIRRALELAGAGPADLLLMAAGPHGADRADARTAAPATSPSARTCSIPTASSSSGSSTSRCSTGCEEEKRWEFMHHPFTAPLESDADRLESDPGSVRARAYDLVLNGSEIGGGSIRIHDQRLQKLVFKLLGMSDEEAKARFGFFVDALEFGTPPHGGIALGLDRIVAILAGSSRSAK